MGVKGLWQYIEKHGVRYELPKDKPSSLSTRNGVLYALRPRHLLIDMNAVLHVSYTAKQPTSRATLQAVKSRLVAILTHVQPTETLVLAFDGVAPIAKLSEQKERRKGLAPGAPAAAPKPSKTFGGSAAASLLTCDYAGSDVPLRQEHITCGSEFVCACELVVEEFLTGLPVNPVDGKGSSLPSKWRNLVVSRSTEHGEGEVKIARHIRCLWQEDVEGNCYSPEDAITIVGNDSDLLLVALAATPYRYLTIVDPDDYTLTCLSELMDHWSSSVPNPPLPSALLPSWRHDFVFIMLLAGCDYYDGVRQHAVELWRRYRDLRSNQGFYRKQLLAGPEFVLDVNFLRCLTEKVKNFMPQRRGGRLKGCGRHAHANRATDRGGTQASAAQGIELLRAALWNFKGYLTGHCADYRYVSSIKSGGVIGVGALRAAAQKAGIAALVGAGAAGGNVQADGTPEGTTELDVVDVTVPLLSPLEQCLAVLGNRGRYSKELRMTIDSFTADGGLRMTTSQSAHFLIDTVKGLMQHVDCRRLSGAEQTLMASPQPVTEADIDAAAMMRHAMIAPKTRTKGEPTAA